MSSKGISVQYWAETYPILLTALAEQSPGMTPTDVAEILDDMDWEITAELNASGEPMDMTDLDIVLQYLHSFA
jgi:hypothetical protein